MVARGAAQRNPWDDSRETLSPGGATEADPGRSLPSPLRGSIHFHAAHQGLRSLRELPRWLPSDAPPGLKPPTRCASGSVAGDSFPIKLLFSAFSVGSRTSHTNP